MLGGKVREWWISRMRMRHSSAAMLDLRKEWVSHLGGTSGSVEVELLGSC